MRDNLGVEGVAVVATGFDDENARPDASVATDGGGDEGGLAGKHRTHNDFETHSALRIPLSEDGERNPFFQKDCVSEG